MTTLLGSIHTRIRPYRPQSNGQIERFNRTLKEYDVWLLLEFASFQVANALLFRQLALVINEKGDNWDAHLGPTLTALRIKQLRATGFSPFELMHTWQFRTHTSNVDYQEVDDIIRRIEADDPDLENTFNQSCQRMVERYAAVSDVLVENVENNLTKEKLRQKKSFDVRNLRSGERVNEGETSLFL